MRPCPLLSLEKGPQTCKPMLASNLPQPPECNGGEALGPAAPFCWRVCRGIFGALRSEGVCQAEKSLCVDPGVRPGGGNMSGVADKCSRKERCGQGQLGELGCHPALKHLDSILWQTEVRGALEVDLCHTCTCDGRCPVVESPPHKFVYFLLWSIFYF